MEGSGVVQISSHYIAKSLWYDGDNIHNVNLKSGLRNWVKPHWITVARANSLKELVERVTWMNEDRATTLLVPERDMKTARCTTILTDGKRTQIYDRTCESSQIGEGWSQLSYGEHMCVWEPVMLTAMVV